MGELGLINISANNILCEIVLNLTLTPFRFLAAGKGKKEWRKIEDE